jgi:hypothetical protein
MHELFALTEGVMMVQWSDVSGSITLSLNPRHSPLCPSPPLPLSLLSLFVAGSLALQSYIYAYGASSHAMDRGYSTELAPYGNSSPPPAYPPPTYQGSPEFQALSRAYEAGLCQFLSPPIHSSPSGSNLPSLASLPDTLLCTHSHSSKPLIL